MSAKAARDVRFDLVTVLQQAQLLLAQPGNDFNYSPWSDTETALRYIDKLLAIAAAGDMRHYTRFASLFSIGGPLEAVASQSGWLPAYQDLAAGFEQRLRRVLLARYIGPLACERRGLYLPTVWGAFRPSFGW